MYVLTPFISPNIVSTFAWNSSLEVKMAIGGLLYQNLENPVIMVIMHLLCALSSTKWYLCSFEMFYYNVILIITA